MSDNGFGIKSMRESFRWNFWFGDEFGPFLIHTGADGEYDGTVLFVADGG
jgi:hypothetical protein